MAVPDSGQVMTPVVALTRELIQRPSVTPADGGCQALLGARLAALGFTLESLRFEDVDNLYARRGSDGPVLCFAGHTDVVPTGPEALWRFPPFAAHIHDGVLYGRGAADMKGSLAAIVCALEAFVGAHPAHSGSLAVLLTSDEEGPAINGTRRVVDALAARGERIDWCIVGEPSSDAHLADRLRNGRRGSLSGRLTVSGIQGHVAYPHLARNPIHDAARLIEALSSERWDDGNADFPPTTLQFSNLSAGTGATNVIPGSLQADFNLRFSTELSATQIKTRVNALAAAHNVDAHIDWHLSGDPFISQPGKLLDAATASVKSIIGKAPRLSTGGGTSDGRFIVRICDQLLELGPCAASIHQVDEHVAIEDLAVLQTIYADIAARLLSDA